MNGFNLSFCLLNNSLNFVPSSPRLAACCEPVSFSYRFRRRRNFFGTSISHRSTHLLHRPVFIFSHRFLFSWSWLFRMPRSFVRVIRGSRAAICHAQIQEFAPPERDRPNANEKKRNAHEAFSYQRSKSTYAILVSFEFFNNLWINLTLVADVILVNKLF